MSRLGVERANSIDRAFYFYAIGVNKTGPIKVGISSHMQRRLIQLQTGNPEKLQIFYTQECSDFSEADAIESAVLGRFRDKAACGEWLKISVQELLDWLKESELDSL